MSEMKRYAVTGMKCQDCNTIEIAATSPDEAVRLVSEQVRQPDGLVARLVQ